MRAGKSVAELIPYQHRSRKPELGFTAGQVQEVEGWDRPMTDAEVDEFLGGHFDVPAGYGSSFCGVHESRYVVAEGAAALRVSA